VVLLVTPLAATGITRFSPQLLLLVVGVVLAIKASVVQHKLAVLAVELGATLALVELAQLIKVLLEATQRLLHLLAVAAVALEKPAILTELVLVVTEFNHLFLELLLITQVVAAAEMVSQETLLFHRVA
jgi:hypothetical protein